MDLGRIKVGVSPFANAKGVDTLDDLEQATPFEIAPLDEALTRKWPSDAHFHTYGLGTSENGTPFRVKLPCVPELAARGGAPVSRIIAIDLDTHGHVAWDKLPVDAPANAKAALTAHPHAIARAWAVRYLTRRGMRLLYVTPSDLSTQEAEEIQRRVVEALGDVGGVLRADPLGVGWWRSYRLPNVVRDGQDSTSEIEYQDAYLTPEISASLPSDPAPKAGLVYSSSASDLDLEIPDADAARALSDNPDFQKFAKKHSKGMSYYGPVFDGDLLAEEGSRNSEIHSLVGKAIEVLMAAFRRLKDPPFEFNPDVLYGLFYDSVEPLGIADDGEDFLVTLWTAICRWWPKHEAKLDGEAAFARELLEYARRPLDPTSVEMIPPTPIAHTPPTPIEPPVSRLSAAIASGAFDPTADHTDDTSADALPAPFETDSSLPGVLISSSAPLPKTPEDIWGGIVGGFRQWASTPADFNTAQEWAARRLVVKKGKSYYVVSTSGHFRTDAVDKDGLYYRIPQLGLGSIMPVSELTKTGGLKMRPIQEILHNHCVEVAAIRSRPQCNGGGYLEDPWGEHPVLVLESFSRNDRLAPQWDARVDDWLWALFGDDKPWVDVWIGRALAFEHGPICAVSIAGAPGCGKGLFVRGLVECLKRPALALGRDLTGSFNAGIMRSPFLSVNEAFPEGRHRNVADAVREAITGDPVAVNEKFQPMIEVRNPMRIIFTANNRDAILEMCRGKDLQPHDREALAIRIAHFDVGDNASRWLAAKGGLKFTRGWIEGQGGLSSSFVVARHFLYLHQIHSRGLDQNPPSQRLLLEGNLEGPVMQVMRAQGGSTPTVIETIVRALGRSSADVSGRTGVRVETTAAGKRLWVTISYVLHESRVLKIGSAADTLNPKRIGSVLRGLAVASSVLFPGDQREWFEVDVELLRREISRYGWVCPILA